MSRPPRKLVCLGFGYCAEALARAAADDFADIAGTTRQPGRARALAAAGFSVLPFDRPDCVDGATHLAISAPPGADGDPVLAALGDRIAAEGGLAWIGYLSTTGVYGDRNGGWVGEEDAPRPDSARAQRRLAAERAWLAFGEAQGVPVQIFRLAGIYGPGRSALDRLRAGTARRIVKPGHVFCRIHVADIAQALRASIARPAAGRIYNLADDEPAPQADVVVFAARLLGVAPPPEERFETAELPPPARGFYAGCRRVRNDRIKRELGVVLRFPSYREGLRDLAPP
ncbi:MAG: SDR family oxidoreductase [Defluviicoccus sp.]|nr:SDR family oxidoreductase [Defluviicoccus sp.]MDE0386033.1 SDR family oxidoreductase [Defluviicoccus sp.]